MLYSIRAIARKYDIDYRSLHYRMTRCTGIKGRRVGKYRVYTEEDIKALEPQLADWKRKCDDLRQLVTK